MSAKNGETLDERQHFMFENILFDKVIAHGGNHLILTRRVLESHTGSAINFIDLTVVPPGADIGVHTHTNANEEIYIIISGQGDMKLDGREFTVGPGHVVVNPPGGAHGLKNTGNTDLRLVVIEVPVPESQ